MVSEFHSLIQTAQQNLIAARNALNAEISDYPTPIAGCDAQFNHLLGERQKVLEAIQLLESDVFVPTPRSPTEMAGVESR